MNKKFTLTQKLRPIFFLTFVNVIGFSLLIPVLPEIIATYYKGPYSDIIFGGLLSTYALMQFLSAPLLGGLSDKFGRRKLLIFSQLGTLLSWGIFAIAYFIPTTTFMGLSVPLLIITFSRVIDGMTGGNVSIANAWISDVTTKAEKTQAFGLTGAIFGTGFLFGPALGGFSSTTQFGYIGTVITAATISFITLAYLIVKLPESLPKEKRNHDLDIHLIQDINVFAKFSVFDHQPFIKSLLKLRTVFAFIFSSFTTMITLVLTGAYNLSSLGMGIVISTIGLFSIVNQAVLVPKIAKKFGNLKTFFIGIILVAIAFILFAPIPTFTANTYRIFSFILFYIDMFFLNLGLATVMTTFKSILTSNTNEHQQGIATGIDDSLRALGTGIAPILAGILFALIDVWSLTLLGILLSIPTIFVYKESIRENISLEH